MLWMHLIQCCVRVPLQSRHLLALTGVRAASVPGGSPSRSGTAPATAGSLCDGGSYKIRHFLKRGTRYLENGLELCVWPSGAHRSTIELCAREVRSHNSKPSLRYRVPQM